MKVEAIIAAGGIGKRMGLPSGKQFVPLLGKPMIVWTLLPFEESKLIQEIILVVNGGDLEKAEKLIKDFGLKKVKITEGGARRYDSVYNGLKLVDANTEAVLIHDGARPLITKEIIERCINEIKSHDAVVVGIPIYDTIKGVDKDLNILNTIDRGNIWSAQTPQGFKYKLIKEAYEEALRTGYKATDDAMLVEKMGKQVKIIMGSYENIKITTKEDLAAASVILKSRREKK